MAPAGSQPGTPAAHTPGTGSQPMRAQGSNQGANGSGAAGAARPSPVPTDEQRTLLQYLSNRGFSRAEQALREEIAAGGSGSAAPSPGGRAVGLDDFAARNAPSAPRGLAQGQQQRRRPDQAIAAGQMLADPPSWDKGYADLRSFVENSLDFHRPELQPILLPLFVHSYLDLVILNYRDAADAFLARFVSDHEAQSPHTVKLLSSIRLASHINESSEASRWRRERYVVRMSERGWGLLLGWLQGGGLAGSVEGTEGRGKDRMLAIINERVKVDAIPGPPAKVAAAHGLESDIKFAPAPQGLNASARSATADKGLEQLRLGPLPADPKLEREVERQLREDDKKRGAAAGPSASGERASGEAPVSHDFAASGSGEQQQQQQQDQDEQASGKAALVSPFPSEVPPYPHSFRTIDVAREVERGKEARKRIKLGPEAFEDEQPPVVPPSATEAASGTASARPEPSKAAKPSVCLFTVHDASESLTSAEFSEDSTLMATGFAESYIKLWSLNGDKLTGLRTDFDSDEVTDGAKLKGLRERDGPATRKLIGHSGPVYSLSFDPTPGPAAPPKYLLSSSLDSTVRLWSLDTYRNLVAYRAHREPVWSTEWGPKGIYFASGSRDRTARLWTTDRTSALRIFAGHLSDVNCVKFHPNSLYLATGSADRTCRLWDVQKGTCVRVFTGHKAGVSALAVSPDGRYLASGSHDSVIRLWDLGSGALVKSLVGHAASVHSLDFSNESSVLVSGSADCTVRIWDVNAPVASDEDGADEASGAALVPRQQQAGRRVSLLNGAYRDGPAGSGGSGKAGAYKGLDALSGAGAGGVGQGPSADLLETLVTKRTPVFNIKFTPRNLALAAGPMISD